MGMKCQRLHFLSLSIWRRVASSLPHHLIFPPTVCCRLTPFQTQTTTWRCLKMLLITTWKHHSYASKYNPSRIINSKLNAYIQLDKGKSNSLLHILYWHETFWSPFLSATPVEYDTNKWYLQCLYLCHIPSPHPDKTNNHTGSSTIAWVSLVSHPLSPADQCSW